MKITLEIPDDVVEDFKERNLYVFAGIDLVAGKNRDDRWKIKTSGCSMCGKCCRDLGRTHPFPVIDKKCIYLINPAGYGDKWFCQLGLNRPFACGVSINNYDYCTVKYEYMKV